MLVLDQDICFGSGRGGCLYDENGKESCHGGKVLIFLLLCESRIFSLEGKILVPEYGTAIERFLFDSLDYIFPSFTASN